MRNYSTVTILFTTLLLGTIKNEFSGQTNTVNTLNRKEQQKNPTRPVDLRCILTSDKTAYKVGELPSLTVEIHNNTKDDIYLIGSLDGSDVQWRFPYCYYSIDSPQPDTSMSYRCGNMNTLRVADFKLIKRGQKFNPYQRVDGYGFFGNYTTLNKETFKTPGVYKLRFHYSTSSENIADFMGDRPYRTEKPDSLKIDALFRKVPRVELESNELEIRVDL